MKEEDYEFIKDKFKNPRYLGVYLANAAQDYASGKLHKKGFARILTTALEAMEIK